ncbi:MAG: phosphatase PAP2 family protein [Burkholderiales bacterium]|nr:phosphatase PAP2 family protein [Burkholderiales bacterium]
MSPPPATTWKATVGLRMRRHFALKLVGTTAFTWVFFIGYFHLLRNPVYPVVVMPLTALDHLVPFQPHTLGIYLSLWFYVGIAPGLQLTFIELIAYGAWIGALCLTGLGIFYFWPTEIPLLMPHMAGFAGFDLLRGVDAAGNACPSMHVAVAMFSAIWIDTLLRLSHTPAWPRLINAAWFVAIAYSTLAIKQHVVLDVLAGALLGIAFAVPALRWRPGRVAAGRGEYHPSSPMPRAR